MFSTSTESRYWGTPRGAFAFLPRLFRALVVVVLLRWVTLLDGAFFLDLADFLTALARLVFFRTFLRAAFRALDLGLRDGRVAAFLVRGMDVCIT